MFGRLLLTHRQRRGLTQEDLAERSGLSVRTIRDLETGAVARPRQSSVRALARVFDLGGPERDAFYRTASSLDLDAPVSVVPRPVPAQLPPDVSGICGRHREIAHLDALLADAEAAWAGGRPTGVRVCAIHGTAGVGKTTLAVHWAHRVAARFPDGQLFVNLRGFHPAGRPVAATEAVAGFLDALGVPPERTPAGLDAQVGLFRSLTSGRRLLVILDNARDAEHVRSILPGTSTALTLVTSRSQLTGLVAVDGAAPLAVGPLCAVEARAVLTRRLGAERIAGDAVAVDRIVAACAGLPLALAIAAARGTQDGRPLASLAADLGPVDSRLDALDAGDRTAQVRDVFSWSYTALSRPAARLFGLLGLCPGPTVSVDGAASLADTTTGTARRLLLELVRAHLVVEAAPGRYTLHDLLRAYAADLVRGAGSADERDQARRRLLDHYLHTAYAADRLLSPHRDPITLTPARAGAVVPHLTGRADAWRWLETEHAVLHLVVEHAVDAGLDAYTWQLAWTMSTLLDLRGHWHRWIGLLRVAVAAARRLGDRRAEALARRLLGDAHTRHDNVADAREEMRRSLDLYRDTGDRTGQAHLHVNLAHVAEHDGRYRDALDEATRAHALYVECGHVSGQARALNAAGLAHGRLGDHRAAAEACEKAISIYRSLGFRHGEAIGWSTLAACHSRAGRHAEAIACYQRALALHDAAEHLQGQANILRQLADAYHAEGDRRAARDARRRARDILAEIAERDAPTAPAPAGGA